MQLHALFKFLVKVGEAKADGCDSNVLETLEKDYTAFFADSTGFENTAKIDHVLSWRVAFSPHQCFRRALGHTQ